MIADDGGAPCVANELLSLAICKPIIRAVAEPGSWIFGFSGVGLEESHGSLRLIYVARVDQRVSVSEYYATGSSFADRGDCIYEWLKPNYRWKAGSLSCINGAALSHDLGTLHDGFSRATVLLSNYYRYFGRHGPIISDMQDDPLRLLLGQLTQGHRVNLGLEERKELDLVAVHAFTLPGQDTVRTSNNIDSCFENCETGIASDDDQLPRDYSKGCN